MSRYLKFTVQHVVGASRDKFRCTFGTEKYRHLMPVVGLLIGFASTFNSAAQDRIQGRALKQDSASGNRTIEPIRKSPKPLPAVPALLTLFDKYQVVGLSDLHGCADLLAFVAQLIRAPEFSAKVNDITWEPGNAMFQNLMDDFILRGKAIEFSQLAQCWRNNTQVHTYSDTPALFHLLQTVRKVNLALPEDRRVRVLLIDPPVDWSKILTKSNLNAHDLDRETHMAKVIEREVYAKGRRALFFAGGAHLSRNGGPL